MAFVYQGCFSGHAICCKNLTPVGVPHGFREAFHKVLLKITTENLAAPGGKSGHKVILSCQIMLKLR